MNHKFLFSLSTLGLLAGISTTETKAETYMCEPCPTGYYCSKGVKNTCPSDSLCVNGTKIAKSSCTKQTLYNFTTPTKSSIVLQPGLYEFEIAGGGGGGGGSYSWDNGDCTFVKCCSTNPGGKGGNGHKTNSTIVYISIPKLLNYTVGAGGNGTGRDPGQSVYGTSGEGSSILIQNQSWAAGGGSGGQGAAKGRNDATKHGANGANNGNGNGGQGGNGASGHDSDCDGKGGGKGANGWVTVYQWIC